MGAQAFPSHVYREPYRKLYVAWLTVPLRYPRRIELNLATSWPRPNGVDDNGKPSTTDYEVIGRHEAGDVIFFYPKRVERINYACTLQRRMDSTIPFEAMICTARLAMSYSCTL